MNLYESGEMYLETIYRLSRTQNHVRSIDVGNDMGYSKPSVSRAISILRKNGYVIMDEDSFLRLTPEGEKIGSKIYQRHLLLTDFLLKIGLDEKTAIEDACKMEHAISDKTFRAIKKHIEKL